MKYVNRIKNILKALVYFYILVLLLFMSRNDVSTTFHPYRGSGKFDHQNDYQYDNL